MQQTLVPAWHRYRANGERFCQRKTAALNHKNACKIFRFPCWQSWFSYEKLMYNRLADWQGNTIA
jgi:hypothetical protein